LAHFLEHMLFNGTENFPDMGVVDFLESIGMEFGPDVNAYTTFDRTVYTIQVPTDDAETLMNGFQVLEDWAAHATLDPDAIDQERGIIVEEWRLRYETAAGRIRDQVLPAILGDSRYADRLTIGDMEIVQNAPPEALERFYRTWYRPDLMAVIAVGDFDVDEMETVIQERFSDLPIPDDVQPLEAYGIPTHDDTQYVIVTDPEKTTTDVQVWSKQNAKHTRTGDDYRDGLIRRFFYSILNERLGDIQRQPDAPFLSARGAYGNYVDSVDVDALLISVEDDRVAAGLESVLIEAARLEQFGVSTAELDRAKEETISLYESIYDDRGNIESKSHADEYLAHFQHAVTAPGIEYEYAFVQEVVPTITVEEVNAIAADLTAKDNRVIVVTAPDKEDVTLPSEQELAAIVDAVAAMAIEPPDEEVISTTLLAEIPDPVAIVSETKRPEMGITEFELENGIQVLIMPTDFMDDEILFTGFSLGGSSLVEDEDYPEASTIVNVITESGVGALGQSELEKLLSGKDITISPYLRELTEGIEGSSSVDDIETLFQLIYLYTTQPRADQDSFEVMQKQMRAALENRSLDPNSALQDVLNQTLYGDTIRRGTLPIEEVDALDLDRAFEIYKERFADMDDAVFIFVGNVAPETIKPLAQTYLGNLPASEREESWQNVSPDLPPGVIHEEVFKGEGDRSIVQIVFNGPYKRTLENDVKMEALETVLDILIREELREELGGVYSSGVSLFSRELPESVYFGVVSFGAEPDRVDELVNAAFAEIAELQANGPSEENLLKARSIALSQDEEALEQNGYWLNAIKGAEIYPSMEIADVLRRHEVIESITVEDVQASAQELFNPDRYVKVILYPEAYEGGE
jgi:zinc protease